MTDVPGTDRDQARENVREETPLVPKDVEGVGDEAIPHGDEGVTGDKVKPHPGGNESRG